MSREQGEPVRAPASGTGTCEAACAGRSPAPAVAAAREAQRAWAATPLPARLVRLHVLRGLVAERGRELARASAASGGPLARESITAEVIPLADACRFLEREAARVLATRVPGARGRPAWLTGVDVEVRRVPLGVVLVIAPANYPLFVPGVQALQALAAGNAVLWKPGAGGGPAARALAALLLEAGFPADILAVLDEAPSAAQEAIRAGVDHVVLTGSARTGAAVLADLAPRLVPSTMELSGCDAAYVQEGADVGRAASAIAFGLSLNGGATCIAPRRVLVARALAASLEAALVLEVQHLPSRRVAPDAAARATRLTALALEEGARLAAGRLGADPAAFSPLVVADARPGMGLLEEEVMAPLVALVPVAGDDDALAVAARCPYALGATVFGEERRARALAARVDAGVVVVNDAIVPTADPRLPFGGRGSSGFGVTRGPEGLLAMTRPQALAVRRGRARHLEPPAPGDEELLLGWLGAAHGATLGRRLASCLAIVRALGARVRGARRAPVPLDPREPAQVRP